MSHNSSYDSSESEGEETMIVGEIPKDRRSLLDGSESESEEEIIEIQTSFKRFQQK